MSRHVGHGRLRASLIAAVLLSAAAHAAVVFVMDSREPIGTRIASSSSTPSRMHVSLAAPRATSPASSPAIAAVPLSHRTVLPTPTTVAAAAPSSGARAVETATGVADEHVDRGPRPLTYPVISLPPDDDPRRVGLVRLLLIVSSEGRVVKTVVTAATLSQDYVDRITESFEAVRFEPATVHGLPRASWYEVLVDFAFDPQAGPSV